MDKQQEPLETLREIRSMMEKSSRFMSLSGISGVVAGISAIAGVVAAYLHLGLSLSDAGYYHFILDEKVQTRSDNYFFLVVDFSLVFVVAVISAFLLSARQATKQGQPLWDATAKRLVLNMIIPLLTGGVYCLVLLYHGHLPMVAPLTLIFYGLALLNASKYTLNEMRYLGMLQIICGLVASIFVEYGMLFWAFGFGVLHIIYGIAMYYKYEK